MADKITVVDWIDYSQAESYPDNFVGGMGGWVNGENFDEFKAEFQEMSHPYLDALRESVVAKQLKMTGDGHQHRPKGVPLFSDGTVSTFSYRGWGDLMAAIWNSEEPDRKYQYMDFYM